MEPNRNPWDLLVTKKTTPCDGITKRELFATMAMQGLLASNNGWEISSVNLSRLSVEHADALLAELSKGSES